MTPVSGRATVAGFTVNHQQWLPAFPPPYVVAVVAIEEDSSARLTTNIVGCHPEDVAIGMRVRVVFSEHDGLWIPLFEPDPESPEEGPVPAPRDLVSALRPMVSVTKFEDKVALTGVGSSTIGRRLMVDPLSLTVQACQSAVADAGLTLDDIDGLATYPGGYPGGMYRETQANAKRSPLSVGFGTDSVMGPYLYESADTPPLAATLSGAACRL